MLEHAKWYRECGVWNISLSYRNLVVRLNEVYIAENGGTVQWTCEVWYEG